MSTTDRYRIAPADALTLLAARHEAICTAYRADAAPTVALPSIYRLAHEVVRPRRYLELYPGRG